MNGFGPPWALCGGWAVDAWLGKVTRDHLDVDITLFAEDTPQLFAHLNDWHFVAHDEAEPTATHPWNGRMLVLPAHIHARPPGERNLELLRAWTNPPYKSARDGSDFDFELNPRDGDNCVFDNEPRLALPIADAFRQTPWGIPALAPVVIAYFKATAYHDRKDLKPRPHDIVDFGAILDVIEPPGRQWLSGAIASKYPDHGWLPRLE